MKIDRMFFNRFADDAKGDETLREAVENEAWDKAQDYVRQEIFDKPEEYYTLEKLREALNLDRRVSLREILEHVFGLIPRIKGRAELLDEEFGKFIAQHAPEDVSSIPAIKAFFVAYAGDESVRMIVDGRKICGFGDECRVFDDGLWTSARGVSSVGEGVCEGLGCSESVCLGIYMDGRDGRDVGCLYPVHPVYPCEFFGSAIWV